jgi:hypothetical protein
VRTSQLFLHLSLFTLSSVAGLLVGVYSEYETPNFPRVQFGLIVLTTPMTALAGFQLVLLRKLSRYSKVITFFGCIVQFTIGFAAVWLTNF